MFQYGYGSIPINTIFSGMNIHLPAILGFTRYQGLTHSHMFHRIFFRYVEAFFTGTRPRPLGTEQELSPLRADSPWELFLPQLLANGFL